MSLIVLLLSSVLILNRTEYLLNGTCSFSHLSDPRRTSSLYGASLDNIDLVRPPPNLWTTYNRGYDLPKQSPLGRPDQPILQPPPPAKPEAHITYPQAPTYFLNECRDNRWRRGYYYYTTYDPADNDLVLHHMQSLRTPPNVAPVTYRDGAYVFEPVPGSCQLVAGVPVVVFLRGEVSHPVTIACLHTPESLAQYIEGPKIMTLVDDLYQYTFGTNSHDGIPGIQPIYLIPGVKPNDRSCKDTGDGSPGGSYNTTSTLLQGNGIGVSIPAVQTAVPEAKEALLRINTILSEFYRLIMPLSVSKEELEVTDFHSIDYNAFGHGLFDPGNTSVQNNVSSDKQGGRPSIGDEQSSWHNDSLDCFVRWTLFVLMFRIPPGEYP